MVIATALTCNPIPAPAADQTLAADSDKQDNPVYITADHLLADTAGRWAQFSGDVRAEQGTTVITADKLKVFYKPRAEAPAAAESAAPMTGVGPIERLHASGRVVIHSNEQVAEADNAEYTTTDRILVLTGQPARVTEAANTVSGGRIVMDRAKNRITVDKPEEGRVEAVFITKDQGLQ